MSPNVPERSRSERPPGSWTRSPLSPHSGSPHFGVSWTFYRAAEPQAVTQQARVWRVTIKLQLNGWKKKSKTNPGTERGTSLMRRKENNKHRKRERAEADVQGGEKKRRCSGAGGGEAIRWNCLQCRDFWLNGSCWDPAYTTGRMQSVPDLQSRCWAAAQSFQNIH